MGLRYCCSLHYHSGYRAPIGFGSLQPTKSPTECSFALPNALLRRPGAVRKQRHAVRRSWGQGRSPESSAEAPVFAQVAPVLGCRLCPPPPPPMPNLFTHTSVLRAPRGLHRPRGRHCTWSSHGQKGPVLPRCHHFPRETGPPNGTCQRISLPRADICLACVRVVQQPDSRVSFSWVHVPSCLHVSVCVRAGVRGCVPARAQCVKRV